MDNRIQWPRAKYWDKAWNPVIGCGPCSPACENCYAKAWAGRFGQSFEPHPQDRKCPRSGVVFAGNMTDLFGEWISFEESRRHIMHTACPEPTRRPVVLFLTKRADRMSCVIDCGLYYPAATYSRHYFGITAENQARYDERLVSLRQFSPHLANGWLSAEPLLGPIDLMLRYIAPEDQPFRWVVVGCESGPNRRPCKLEWVESVVDQCRSAGVPVFVKQLDIGGKCVTDIGQFPEHLRIRQVPWQGMGMTRRDDPEAGASGTGQEGSR